MARSALPIHAPVAREVDDNFDIDISESAEPDFPSASATAVRNVEKHSKKVEDATGHSSTTGGSSPRGAVREGEEVGSDDPAHIAFEGEGLSHVGSAKAQADEFDDEFDYAFSGGERQGDTHKQVFKPKALPAHLVTNVKQAQLNAVMEDGEDEDGEAEEEEDDERQDERPAMAMAATDEVILADDGHRRPDLNLRDSNHLSSSATSLSAASQQEEQSFKGLISMSSSAVSVAGTAQARYSVTTAADQPAVEGNVVLPASSISMASDPDSNFALAGSAAVKTSISSMSLRPHVPPSVGLTALDDGGSETHTSLAHMSCGSGNIRAEPGTNLAGHSASRLGRQATEDEWEVANQLREQEMAVSKVISTSEVEPISYPEVSKVLLTEEPSDVNQRHVLASLPPPPSFFQRMMCMGHPDLASNLKDQRIRLLCLARVAFNDSSPVHFRLLCSLYAAFTGKSVHQPRIGTHWEDVGFQGQDPATDLRSSGILGLLHLYYLHFHNRHNAQLLYALSRSASQEFPLSIVSMNITKWTLQVMREGLLSKAANRCGSMVEASNHFYVGTFYTFYKIWLEGGKTMSQSGFVLKELEATCRKHAQLMIDRAATTLEVPP